MFHILHVHSFHIAPQIRCQTLTLKFINFILGYSSGTWTTCLSDNFCSCRDVDLDEVWPFHISGNSTFAIYFKLLKQKRQGFYIVLSISSHISENLSDPRLLKYTWIIHFMECKLSQDGKNSWHMRPFLAPKCLILAPFSYPKIIFRKNFTTISIIFS